jgi:O-antigen/teichoic acid export membrane protein
MLKLGTLYLNKIRSNAFVLKSINTMILRIFGILLLFVFTLYLTHNYNPEIIGEYDFTRTYLLVLGSICMLGTEQSILYFTGSLKTKNALGELKAIYKKMVLMIFIVCSFIFLLLFLTDPNVVNGFFNDHNSYSLLFRATGILFFYALTLLNTEVFRALDSLYIAELYRNTFKYASVIIGAIVLFKIHEETYLVDTFLAGFFILAIISSVSILKLFDKQIKDTPFNSYSHSYILKKSFPMAISAMGIFLLMSFDVIFIKKFKGDASVAFYAVAVKLMSILFMIMNSVNITLATKISEYFTSGNIVALRRTIKHSSRLIFALSCPIVVVVCFFADNILGFFGSSYLQAKPALLILMIGQGICSLFGVVHVYLNMTGRQNIFQAILVGAVIINFLLNRFLVPIYGMEGGAIAYTVSMFLWNFIAAVIIYNKDNISVFLT